MQSTTTIVDSTSGPRQNWMPWIVVSIMTFLYATLCLLSGRRMEDYANDFQDFYLSIYRPVIITSMFTGVLVFIFIAVSFLITWGRSTSGYASRSLDAVYAACLLYMFLLTLLSAASLNGFRTYLKYARDHESSPLKNSDYDVFAAAFVFGYLCAILYLLYALFVAWSAISFPQRPQGGMQPVAVQDVADEARAAPLIGGAYPNTYASDSFKKG